MSRANAKLKNTRNEFVGNGLDRSGIGILTATLYKIRIEFRIEYNTLRLKPEQASLFPTIPFWVFFNS